MPLLLTGASGANGNGYGSLLAFDRDGKPLGVFSEDRRIVDPRGLAIERKQQSLFLNSIDRVLALDAANTIPTADGVYAYSLQMAWQSFGSRAGCALGPTPISTA